MNEQPIFKDMYAIELEGVFKKYRLYKNKTDRLKEAFNPLQKKYYRDFYALNDITLRVRKGEILGIVGKNGSGKSTLLKIIAGVLTPSSGRIATAGNIVPLLELGSGFNPEYTGIENIFFYSSLLGFSRKEIETKLSDILDFAEVGEFINQPLKTYSSGMKARLAFAVSVNIDPDILILDEILMVGDELFRRKSFARMEEFFRSGKTIIYVSHAINTINELCTRVILLDDGELILDGEPKFVTNQYQKLLFSKRSDRERVRKEICTLGADGSSQAILSTTREKKAPGIPFTMTEPLPEHNIEKEHHQAPYFLPDFLSKAPVMTRNYDVDIENITIRTTGGEKVNALVMDREYVISCRVKFHITVRQVNFSLAIRTETGLLISGVHTPAANQYVDVILAGEALEIEWTFVCQLLPANYYINIGVRSHESGEPVVLNRILDACVFKVLPDGQRKFCGITHFSQSATIKRTKA